MKTYWLIATEGFYHLGQPIAPGTKFGAEAQHALDAVASGRARFVDPHEHREAAHEATSAVLRAEGKRSWLTGSSPAPAKPWQAWPRR